jgi:hypothetical protein
VPGAKPLLVLRKPSVGCNSPRSRRLGDQSGGGRNRASAFTAEPRRRRGEVSEATSRVLRGSATLRWIRGFTFWLAVKLLKPAARARRVKIAGIP